MSMDNPDLQHILNIQNEVMQGIHQQKDESLKYKRKKSNQDSVNLDQEFQQVRERLDLFVDIKTIVSRSLNKN